MRNSQCERCGTIQKVCHYVRGVFCEPCHKDHAKEEVEKFSQTGLSTDCTNEVTCPWCGFEFEDSWEFSDEGKVNCDECEKNFIYSRDVSVSYSSSKA